MVVRCVDRLQPLGTGGGEAEQSAGGQGRQLTHQISFVEAWPVRLPQWNSTQLLATAFETETHSDRHGRSFTFADQPQNCGFSANVKTDLDAWDVARPVRVTGLAELLEGSRDAGS
jgi:hypothetical protein